MRRREHDWRAYDQDRGGIEVQDTGPEVLKPEDFCPRCGNVMDRVLDRGTMCFDQLLEVTA